MGIFKKKEKDRQRNKIKDLKFEIVLSLSPKIHYRY